MNKLIHIGFGNIVNAGKIIAIVSPDSAPVKRMVQKAKEEGTVIDAIAPASSTLSTGTIILISVQFSIIPPLICRLSFRLIQRIFQ